MWGRFALILGILAAGPYAADGQTLWTENAENGLTYVIDGTDSSYSLIQSDFFTEGSYGFHLANPGLSDNWFTIDRDISVQADTKLFFQSRLSWASQYQVAKVQISTNGGSTWSSDIYSQAGTGGAGEGAFALREVDLSPYAAQDARFRFYYDFTGSSGFPQSTTNVGWRIDDIQIGAELSKTLYSIGNPSADAQLYLEHINRARADAMVEANRLANETDSDITDAYNYSGIDRQDIVDQFQWYVDNDCMDQFAQPLAFNAALNEAAELHTQDMFDNQFQGHSSSANAPSPFLPGYSLGQRATATGYSWTGLGENVFSHADSVEHGHAGFNVDWGGTTNVSDDCYNPAFADQGMQNPAGHRRSIHNDGFKEIGIGVVNGTNGSVGPQLVTQDFGTPGEATFVTGVVYDDLDGDNFYDVGEGRSGVRVDVDGSGFYAISSDSGGYSLPVSGDGQYMVSFTGNGFDDFVTQATVLNGDNVKVDYLVSSIVFADEDFNRDGYVDGLDLAQWRGDHGLNADSDADKDGDSDGLDFLAWQRAAVTGSALEVVPEPTAIGLGLAGLLILASARAVDKLARRELP